MSFFEFPNTRTYDSDLGWLIEQMNKINTDLASLEERVLRAAIEASKEYIDNEVADIKTEFNRLEIDVINLQNYVDNVIAQQQSEFNSKIAELQSNYNQFTNTIQAQVSLLSQRVDALRDEINADIIGVNARTDLLIKQNNEYILSEVAKGIVNATVINYFTGARISVQDMFNYLAMLHSDNAITFTDLAARAKTYTEYAALNITYTQLAMNGNILIV